MKMYPEHYQTLKECMGATRNNPRLIELDVYGNLSDTAFVWHWFYATPINGQRAEVWANENLYPYLNDSHIETALKRILVA